MLLNFSPIYSRFIMLFSLITFLLLIKIIDENESACHFKWKWKWLWSCVIKEAETSAPITLNRLQLAENDHLPLHLRWIRRIALHYRYVTHYLWSYSQAWCQLLANIILVSIALRNMKSKILCHHFCHLYNSRSSHAWSRIFRWRAHWSGALCKRVSSQFCTLSKTGSRKQWNRATRISLDNIHDSSFLQNSDFSWDLFETGTPGWARGGTKKILSEFYGCAKCERTFSFSASREPRKLSNES